MKNYILIKDSEEMVESKETFYTDLRQECENDSLGRSEEEILKSLKEDNEININDCTFKIIQINSESIKNEMEEKFKDFNIKNLEMNELINKAIHLECGKDIDTLEIAKSIENCIKKLYELQDWFDEVVVDRDGK